MMTSSWEAQMMMSSTNGGGNPATAGSSRVMSGGRTSFNPPRTAGSTLQRAGTATTRLGQTTTLSETDNIKVAVRVRPLFLKESEAGANSVIQVTEDNTTIKVVVPGPAGNRMQRDFQFHACLAPTVSQADVLHLCGVPQLLDAALAGYNVTVFAYGQTGSGKTYTMSGKEEVIGTDVYTGGDRHDGIVTRSVSYLYGQVAQRKDTHYSMSASYLEIYNEGIFDLLNLKSKNLPVKWDPGQGFFVPGLKTVTCPDLSSMMDIIRTGMKHRHVGSHELNIESSRSHSIMTVMCCATPTDPNSSEYGVPRFGKICFVDLAGSERLRDSKCEGVMLKETTNINKSLFVLGKVISALAEADASGTTAHIPYRDSKLTKLLMDSLGGSALALMIACCSPSSLHVEETLSTLSYATRAKNIQNRPTVQYDPKDHQINMLRREIDLLRQENGYLREQLRTGGSFTGDLMGGSTLRSMSPKPSSDRSGDEGGDRPSGGRPDWPSLNSFGQAPQQQQPPGTATGAPGTGSPGGLPGAPGPGPGSQPPGTSGGMGRVPSRSGPHGGGSNSSSEQPYFPGIVRDPGAGGTGGGASSSAAAAASMLASPLALPPRSPQLLPQLPDGAGGATPMLSRVHSGGHGGGNSSSSMALMQGPSWQVQREGRSPPGHSGGDASTSAGEQSGTLHKRLQDTQALLSRFSEENSRLAKENDRLRSSRVVIGAEHADVIDEIESLRTKLSSLETAVLSGSHSPSAIKAILATIKPPGTAGSTGGSPSQSTPPSRGVMMGHLANPSGLSPSPLGSPSPPTLGQYTRSDSLNGAVAFGVPAVPASPLLGGGSYAAAATSGGGPVAPGGGMFMQPGMLAGAGAPAAAPAALGSAWGFPQGQGAQHGMQPHPPSSAMRQGVPTPLTPGLLQPQAPSPHGSATHGPAVANVMSLGQGPASAMRTRGAGGRGGGRGSSGYGPAEGGGQGGDSGIIVADASKLNLLLGLGGGASGGGSAVGHAQAMSAADAMAAGGTLGTYGDAPQSHTANPLKAQHDRLLMSKLSGNPPSSPSAHAPLRSPAAGTPRSNGGLA